MKAVALARTRTTKQHRLSAPSQLDLIREWCESRGYEVVRELADCGSDDDDVLEEAVEVACDLDGVLVVYDMTRLTRSAGVLLGILDRMEMGGAGFAAIVEDIDTTSRPESLRTLLSATSAIWQFNQGNRNVQ